MIGQQDAITPTSYDFGYQTNKTFYGFMW